MASKKDNVGLAENNTIFSFACLLVTAHAFSVSVYFYPMRIVLGLNFIVSSKTLIDKLKNYFTVASIKSLVYLFKKVTL